MMTNLLHGAHVANKLFSTIARLRLLLVMFLTLTVSANAWGETYNFSNIPTSGWKTAGASQTINGKSWTYTSSTYIGVTNSRIQVGSSNKPQTSNWTIQIPISSFGTNIKVTKVAITAYTTATTATYDISVSGSSVKSGNLTTSSATYSSNTLNATTGNIVVTLKGSNNSKAMYLSNIAVTYETAAAHTVTWTINPAAGGILSAPSGNTTTVTPNAAYTYANPAYTVMPAGKANVSQDGNNFTATPSANCTIQINMVTKTPANISFENMGNPTPTTTGYYVGDTYTLPETNDYTCGEKTFVGWSTEIIEKSATKPNETTYYEPGASVTLKAEQTFYAVFAEGSGHGEEGWQKVTSTSEVKTGESYLLISFDEAYYLANVQSTSNPAVKSISKQNGKLSVTDEMKWIATANNDGFEFKSYSNNNYYLWGGSANDAIRINTTSTKANATKVWYTKKLDTYGVVIYHNASTDGAKHLATNGSTDWRNYLNNNTLNNTNRVAILYKFIAGTTYTDYTTQCATETTVTLQPNGGTGTAKVLETTDGSLTLPECDFTYEDYRFVGWNTKAEGTGTTYQPSAEYTPTENPATLYAKWAKEYTVTYNANGGTTTCEDNKKYIAGEQVTVCTSAPTRDSYTFNGWSYSPNVAITDGQFAMPENDVTITAQWTSNKTTTSLTWSPTSYSATIDVDNDFPELTKSPADLSPIAYSSSNTGVATIDVNTGEITLNAAGTTTITATFTETNTHAGSTASYTLTVNPSNCRWVEVTDNTTLEDGDEVVITMVNGGSTYALPNNQGTSTPDGVPADGVINGSEMTSVANTLKWTVDKSKDNYIFHPNGDNSNWLYCINSDNGVRVGTNENKTFTIDPTSGYLKHITTSRYLRIGFTNNSEPVWRCYTTSTAGQTLKFYKKTCLPADEYWVNYNLSNVTCTTDPIVQTITASTEVIQLMFEANNGYVLPEDIDVQMVGSATPLSINWNETTGSLNIHKPTDGFTGNITISIAGCKALAAPKNMSVQDRKSSSVRLSWDAVNDAQSYRVFVTDFNDHDIEIKDIEDCFVEVTGLKQNTTYTWDVTAFASDYDCQIPSELSKFTTLQTYTVTFNSNGGTAVESQTVDHGTKATKPANPTKTGYTFAGWYTEADTEFNFNTPIESATTLYAKWNATQYTITFLKQNGSGGTDKATVTFDSNNFSVATIDLPTRNEYEFGGYYTEKGGAGLQIVDAEGKWLKNKTGYLDASGNWIKAGSVDLYAKWTKIHTITWVVNNNTATPHYTSMVLDGNIIDQLPTPPADDLFADCDVNAFVGWSTDNIGLEPDPTAPTDLFKTPSEAQSKIGAINGDKKFYAVYANASNGADSYKLATTLEDLFDGQTVIIAKDNGALEKDNNTIDKVNISPDGNGNLSNVTDNIKWTLEASDTHWKLKNNGGYLGVDGTDNQTAVSVTEENNVWQIAKSAATGDYFYICQPNTTTGLQYYNSRWQIYSNNGIASSTNFTLKIYVPNVSNYITRCTALPDPVWGGATIDKNEIAVNCGETSSTNGAARISFPKETNYNLYKDITVEVTSGNFIIASSRDGEYTTSVTLTPTQSGTNVGTLDGKYVYVRAVAPPMSSDQLTGTITISGKQITTQVINVTATVTCNEYTLTFNDCGDTKKITDFAGTSVEEMEPWAETCSEPFQYVFDGWATEPVTNGTEGYKKVSFPYTMPKDDQTLYAVYRYAEEGGEPVNGYVKVTEALADWSGDYVIVNETAKKAIGNTYANTKTLSAVEVEIEDDKVVSPSESIIWQIRKDGDNYTMYNADAETYAYITGTKSENAGLSDTKQNITISWGSSASTIRVCGSGEYTARCFSYFSTNSEWRTYSTSGNSTGALYRSSNKTIRYTSSLVCGIIEAENAIVTSTVGQTIKVYVPITLGYSDAASITGTSDNEAFTVVTKNDVAVGESTIEVHYKPTAYVNTANQEETATITLTTSNGATTTFNITGRCLPETFAIVAKVGNVWYALPSQGLNSETTPVGYPVKVDNNDNPTVVTSLPTKAEWALRNVYKVNGPKDRFAANGENLVFVNAENKTLYASKDNANIQTYAEYSSYATNNPERYEWVPTTTDLVTYTLKNVGRAKELSINVNATFGTHASNIASNNLRFLPINATYNPFDMQVVEWYPTKVLVQTEAALTSVSATVGGVAVANPVVTKKGGKLYEISGLPLENNPTKILTISYDSYSCSKVIPIIISQETKTVTDAPFSTLTKAIYNYSDLVVRDGAVLNITGAKNTPDKFVNVTIYPTAKVVVPENNQLSVYSLTFFGGIDDIYDGEKYTTNKYGVPQLSLKGTLGKTVTTMDYIMRVNTDQMYSLGVPYDVNLGEITYWDGSAIKLSDELYVSAYDGQARANLDMNNTWRWEVNFAEKVLKAGIGYTISAEPQAGDTYSILRMPMKSNINSGNSEAAKSVAVTAHGADANIADNHKGWNLVANPYMASIKGDSDEYSELMLRYMEMLPNGTWQWTGEEQRYVSIPYNDGSGYYQLKFSEAVLEPFKNFFVQVATSGELNFVLAHRQNAPARYLQTQEERKVEFELLLSNSILSDNTGLLISEKYSPAYEINADLEKMTGTMSVYTIYNGYTLAYNALSPLNAEEQIPVGYIVPANGEYTFDLKEHGDYDKVEHIYLIDREMDAMVDLLEETYDFYAVEKKNNNRFAISVILKSEQSDGDITTNLGEIDIHNKQPQKFFYDGELYILHDGKVYSATGHEIKTINE